MQNDKTLYLHTILEVYLHTNIFDFKKDAFWSVNENHDGRKKHDDISESQNAMFTQHEGCANN